MESKLKEKIINQKNIRNILKDIFIAGQYLYEAGNYLNEDKIELGIAYLDALWQEMALVLDALGFDYNSYTYQMFKEDFEKIKEYIRKKEKLLWEIDTKHLAPLLNDFFEIVSTVISDACYE